MKIKFIGCEILKNELLDLGIDQVADCDFFEFSLHKNPENLNRTLQRAILENQDYDRIVLGYCRCSAALLGLYSPKTQLLFPTTHDCVGLILGSTKQHLNYIFENPGTLYLSQGFLNYGVDLYEQSLSYFEKYGEKKARKVIKALYGGYNRALFINTPGIKDKDDYQNYLDKSRQIVDFFGWNLDEVEGDSSLMKYLVEGIPQEELILLEPGQKVTEDCFAEYPMTYKL